ncbi:MAG: NlpC/P60 family protein [Myxococcota bacterium]
MSEISLKLQRAPTHRRSLFRKGPCRNARNLVGATILLPALLFFSACGAAGSLETIAAVEPRESGEDRRIEPRPSTCPETAQARDPLPGVTAEQTTLAYWLARSRTYGSIDRPLLSVSEIHDHQQAIGLDHPNNPSGEAKLLEPLDRRTLALQIRGRIDHVLARFEEGAYQTRGNGPLSEQERTILDRAREIGDEASSFHVALDDVQIRCTPLVGTYVRATGKDPRHNRNNCSRVSSQEVLQVLSAAAPGALLVRTRYSLGWIDASARLSAALSEAQATAWVRGPKATAHTAQTIEGQFIPQNTRLPYVLDTSGDSTPSASEREAPTSVYVGTEHDIRVAQADNFSPTDRPLTRRAVLTEAFSMLGRPYGWGGQDGGVDCSRFVLEIFERFGLELPRVSAMQARAGSYSIDVSAIDSDREKMVFLDAAARRGIVLLHLPGHIMLYLGRTEEGTPMVLHSFADFQTDCPVSETGGARRDSPLETVQRVDRVAVSTLDLGRGTSKSSLLERVRRIVVLGGRPGIELRGVTELRPAAPVRHPSPDACHDSLHASMFRSPNRPHRHSPLRVIATMSEDPGPVDLVLFDPDGLQSSTEVHSLGAPPYSYWTAVDRPKPGIWTAVLGDGERIEACERIPVYAAAPPTTAAREVPWTPRWRWEADTENFYAAFVEQLFREPEQGEVTWPELQVLIDDPARNLLHGHLGQSEDAALRLRPDCADLPYTLRAYFAWKTRLPMAFRRCSRGRAGRAPRCGELEHNLADVEPVREADAGRNFFLRVRGGVHSGTARTLPDDDETDLYPVALDRESLKPGTVFADPYGHLLVIARWIPQTLDRYGVLVAADAQPDGTVGRRRFWRGSFLFTPSTEHVGAGFKAFRPVVVDASTEVRTVENKRLNERSGYVPFSQEQYRGSRDEFYQRMESLINPRPLDPYTVQLARLDALEEAVARRIQSVENGERFMADRSFKPIEMPEGYALFETDGAWEEFSTPSRDMRLLTSIDAVQGVAEWVRNSRARFGVRQDEVEETIRFLKQRLKEQLERRFFEYARSDGSRKRLTLSELVQRVRGFEVAYNPNDCVELRWAASIDSEEGSTCLRHAPEEQRARMESYRSWFEARQRPPR